ncbi:MAG: hypothetical protein K8R44_07245 [Sulfurimonas sp.]|nr:hypothetical protein [Sulfurimonas sp.]
MKYANYIILFILLSVSFIFKDTLSLSTNLLSLFASKESVNKLHIATELGYTKELLIAVKGFDNSSKKIVEELVEELNKVDGIKQIQYKTTPSKEIQKYYKQNYAILGEFNSIKLDSLAINEKLKFIYNEQMNSFFYTPIDKNDPLKLFKLDSTNKINFSTRGSYLTLGDYGYLINIKTDVSPSQIDKAKVLYKDIKTITDIYPEVIAFAGFFYTVENSSKIKGDVSLIAVLSGVILLFMYFVLLKNIRVLFHTLIALTSSTIFAILGTLAVFDNFHAISLGFGVSITAVSIDYLFHYYFHNFYSSKKRVDKNVLYGFLTTLSAFAIFSFIPVTLISQISFFTLLSLSFAYIVFTFVFKHLDLKEYSQGSLTVQSYSMIPSYIFLIAALLLLSYSFLNIKLDNNIRNLDYQNEKLYNIEKIFKESSKTKLQPVLIQATCQDKLLKTLHILQKRQKKSFSLASFVLDKDECLKRKKLLENYDFDRLNKMLNEEALKVGFRDFYFSEAYKFTSHMPSCEIKNLDIFNSYGLSTYKSEDNYYTIAMVYDVNEALKQEGVCSINVKDMFSKVADKMYQDIAIYSIFVMSIIILLLIFSVRKRFFYAINYILFPLSFTLTFLVTFFNINIMHIFAFIILIAIGIDYGIYMSNTKKVTRTMLAIKYSLLSTFGAFGVLVFSSITALSSIGLVISLGVLCIFFLIKVMK